MSDGASPQGSQPAQPDSAPDGDFRWTAFFQRGSEPLFVLNRRRQILFVNHAWEELTGFARKQVYKSVCKRHRNAEPESLEAVLTCISPTRDALEGRPLHVRRMLPRRAGPPRWWDVELFPLLGPHGLLGLIGKIHEISHPSNSAAQPLPEKLLGLRQRLTDWHGLEHLPTDVPAMRRVAEQVRLASRTNVPVLLLGESGSGKEWLARTIHKEGPEREKPFIVLDCHHLPAAALAWTLFGTPGLAQRGGATLYLKCPSSLPRELQARLCEQFAEAGDESHWPRLLAGSSGDMLAEVKAGRLLEEFHCLLSPLTIQVPPLRERLGDLSLLVERFLSRASSGRDTPITGLNDDAWQLLRCHAWPGNLRELYTVLAGASDRCKTDRLGGDDLPWFLRSAPAAPDRNFPLDKTLEEVERRLVQLALVMAKGNKSRAAELLQIPRARLLRRLAALGIE
jgi:PAS domain S-box-containing protein